ncbi:putative membrane protein YesL [Actinoplanes tereljensis]|uniref:DUF624 domain-containing protein n=1 Tax=Paractinoplanes tereljensis TaxID=571912 RepID=A0A919NGP5_9ACTN|nr:DUF624 domain-containing protein [Actinoplanes tereljensis]GIF17487.1 hypothetical protein Ate02nite_02170 [Actinoplanes tereljensis]
MTPAAWALRLYEAADEIFWAIRLSLLWTVGTLAGGVVLGVGPATLAAYTVARHHAAGETGSSFVRAYRNEFRRGSALVLPITATAILLITNYHWLADRTARTATLAALAFLAVIAAYLLPMAVHYDLRTPALLPKASRFALLRIPASALLLLTLLAFGFAVAAFPVLLVVAVGGWIQLDTWLCLRLFAENEALRKGLT